MIFNPTNKYDTFMYMAQYTSPHHRCDYRQEFEKNIT